MLRDIEELRDVARRFRAARSESELFELAEEASKVLGTDCYVEDEVTPDELYYRLVRADMLFADGLEASTLAVRRLDRGFNDGSGPISLDEAFGR